MLSMDDKNWTVKDLRGTRKVGKGRKDEQVSLSVKLVCSGQGRKIAGPENPNFYVVLASQ